MLGDAKTRFAVACGVALSLGFACATGVNGDDDGASGGYGTGGASAGGSGAQGGAVTSSTSNGSSSSSSGGAAGGGGSSTTGSGGSGGMGPVCGDSVCDTPTETCLTCSSDCPGVSDCDNDAMNGCECVTPGCCANACQTQHANGLGQFFYDCLALGTYDEPQATKAANVWPITGTVISSSCTGPGQNKVVCKQAATNCACWNYSGSNVGHVLLNSVSSTCTCPTTTDPSWN